MDTVELETRLEEFVAVAIDEERIVRGVAAADSATDALLLAVARRLVRRGLLLGYVLGQADLAVLEGLEGHGAVAPYGVTDGL